MDAEHKLKLLEQYASEYYDIPRKYSFIEHGYVCYELFTDVYDVKCVLYREIYVDKDNRNSGTFKELCDLCAEIFYGNDCLRGYITIDKGNEHKDKLEYMFNKYGFIEYDEDENLTYYVSRGIP